MQGKRRFRFQWIPTLTALVITALLLKMGMWQVARSKEKEKIMQAHEERLAAPPLTWTPGMDVPDPEKLKHRRLVVEGEYDPDGTFLWDSRVYKTHIGFNVINVLRLSDGSAVLVNRGWVRMGPRRTDRPEVTLPQGKITIQGRVKAPANKSFYDGPNVQDRSIKPFIVQSLSHNMMQPLVEGKLLPVVILLDPDQPDGYVRKWEISLKTTPEMHLVYALQWLLLALAMVIIWLVWSFRKEDENG